MRETLGIGFFFMFVLCISCSGTQEEPSSTAREKTGTELGQHDMICYFFFIADCPASRNNLPKMVRLFELYEELGLEVIGVVSDPEIDSLKLAATLAEFEVSFSIMKDDSLHIAKKHRATVTPQVFLYDQDSTLVYSGMIDNYYYELGKHRKIVSEAYLEDAIVNLLIGEPIVPAETKPIGCLINHRFF